MRPLILPLVLVTTSAVAGCVPTPPVLRPQAGPSVYAKDLGCRPSPEPPTAPSAGPPSVGVGSVVYKDDGTSDSFLVYESLRGLSVEGAAADVKLIDLPADADYALSGYVHGPVMYRRDPKAGANSGIFSVIAFSTGTTATIMGTTLALTGQEEVGEGILIGGGIALGVSLVAIVFSYLADANEYAYAQRVDLVLRREGEPIGYFSDVQTDRMHTWQPDPNIRRRALAHPLGHLKGEIARCIEADRKGAAHAARR